MKIYKQKEDWNELENSTGKASYSTLVHRYTDNMVLCNNILSLDENLLENIVVGHLEEYDEIFQAFITDIAEWEIESLQELGEQSDIIVAYSEMLDCYILLVTHLGTSWSYVPTDIELTDNFEEI